MTAKAKQGLRALNQVGFDLKKLRTAVEIYQKTVAGKLKNVEKEAEDLTSRVQAALKAVMNILTDATNKASKTLSEVSEASNDLGRLGKDIQGTKTHDMITKIREMIAEKPADKKTKNKKADDKKHDNKKPGDAKSGDNKTAKATKPTETKKEDHAKSKKRGKFLRPKDTIPGANNANESLEAQRLLADAEMYEYEETKRARDAIEKKIEDNKRAVEKTKDFLTQVENGLLQVYHGIAKAGMELN